MSQPTTSITELGELHVFATTESEPIDSPNTTRVIVGIAKPPDSGRIKSTEPEVTVFDDKGDQLEAKQAFADMEYLVEANTGGGATASAYFDVQLPPGRKIGAVHVQLRGATAELSFPDD